MNNKKKFSNKTRFLICGAAYLLIVVLLIVITSGGSSAPSGENSPAAPSSSSAPQQGETEQQETVAEQETKAAVKGTSYMIEGVPTIQQSGLSAGCETYACTMLLQWLGYDIDEYRFADNYLICSSTSWDGDTHYGPDMYSAMAGTAYAGFGIYAPAMAKSMNKFFADVGSQQKAYPLDGVSLEDLCREYIDNNIPVMVWATTWMWEPGTGDNPLHRWYVDYVDPEIGRAKVGDEVYWKEHEHCLVLIGYDEDEYYFADSYKGAVSHFDKELSQHRYEQIGTMAIVVK